MDELRLEREKLEQELLSLVKHARCYHRESLLWLLNRLLINIHFASCPESRSHIQLPSFAWTYLEKGSNTKELS